MQPVIFVALALLAGPAPRVLRAQARENAYDVLGKALVPLARVIIAPGKNHAFTATLALDSATNLAAADAGDTLEIAVESPDKLRLRLQLPSGTVTICRNGQEIWGAPGVLLDALIASQDLPKPDPDFKIGRLTLPVTEKQLVLLPALFQVQDAGDEVVNGENCMVLDVTLMPELAHSLKAQDYSARLWVGADYKIVKIELRRHSEWHAVVLVKTLEYAASLPAETWQPTHDESMDLLQLTPARYKQLLDAVAARWTAFKAKQ